MAKFIHASLHRNSGLTLIEVLIALAILSIALTAVIYTTASTIRQTTYLNERTLATWVGFEIINEIQSNLRKIPLGETISDTETMGNQTWHFNATRTSTPNPAIQKITVVVSPLQNETKILANIDGFYYAEK